MMKCTADSTNNNCSSMNEDHSSMNKTQFDQNRNNLLYVSISSNS